MSMTELQQLQKEWLEKNPLRKFRTEQKMALYAVASFLNVSPTSLQKWEIGVSRPVEENMDKLSKLTHDKNIAKKWDRWLAEAPKL